MKTLFRWSFGSQNTLTMENYELEQYKNMLWLMKISIVSFQIWFPEEKFVILYNGSSSNFNKFIEDINSINPPFCSEVTFLDQNIFLKKHNPYPFLPSGVWWKWVPFRLDSGVNEIAVDTDIICVNDPLEWKEWIENDTELLIAPERFEKVQKNTCGELFSHPLIVNKKPYNCGIVGQKKELNYEQEFFEATSLVNIGHTPSSFFIDEQGVVNIWIRELENKGVNHHCLSFEKNVWVRDFLFYLKQKQTIETIHAVTWTKKILFLMKETIENKVLKKTSDLEFMSSIFQNSKHMPTIYKNFLLSQFYASKPEELNKDVFIFEKNV